MKELSIKGMKKELMDAFLGDMRIINSFSSQDVKKVTEYIGKNIFDYLDESPHICCADTYINFDVSEMRGYNACIIIKMHKDLIKLDGENKIDTLGSVVKEIVTDLYPYMTGYSDMPKQCCNGYIERHIRFTLREYDKSVHEDGGRPIV